MSHSSPHLPPGLRALRAALVVIALVAVERAAAQPAAPAKRPLTHADYDGWKSVQQPVLSRDGRYFAYNLMPADGDGAFVVRNLATGGEHRIARGRAGSAQATAQPNRTASAGEYEEDDDQQRRQPGTTAGTGARPASGETVSPLASAAHQFTPDGRAVIFALVPTKNEVDKARQEKVPAAEMPRPILAVMELPGGKIIAKIERVNSFTIVGEGAGLLVYRRAAKPPPAPGEKKDGKPAATTGDDQPPPAAPQPGTPGRTPPRTYGTDLVLRNLADGAERAIEDVTEYSFTRDAKTLVYAVSSKIEETNGVYAVTDVPAGAAAPLAVGKGRYSRLTWDEKQTQLVFFSDRDTAATEKPKAKLYHWHRNGASQPVAAKPGPVALAKATDLLTLTPAGIRAGWSISERGAVSFSADGTRLYVNTAPDREEKKDAAPGQVSAAPPATGRPADDQPVFDLWHWKDDLIQPMQKARGGLEGNRTFRAVYSVQDKQFRHLSDENIDVTPLADGDWALSSDARLYRKLTGYGATLNDYALVNIRNGETRPLLQAWQWSPSVAHDGKHLAFFDGKDWNAVAVADGKRVNLTARLPVKFMNEQWDTPSEPPAYGFAGWTSDAKHVLIYDRYDVWKAAVDGSAATMLTAGIGRKTRTQLRFNRPGGPGGPRAATAPTTPTTPTEPTAPGAPTTPAPGTEEPQRGIDLGKPHLLKAVNESTRDEGFYRVEPGAAEPKLLVMGARAYGTPVKAKDAETYLLTISTFYDAPDYFVTGADFREFKQVTDSNPKKSELNWGKAELVRYKNLDGVELSGVLIKPENFDPHQKYPMIVYIYERLSQNLHRFVAPNAGTSINPTYYASNGYLVFMPDIVYTVGSPGQSAIKCVLPAIQAVVDKGCVDEGAIGIQGHSWGGYQIAYMITQTTRFKAAAAGAPVSNMVSAYDGVRWGTGLPRQFQYERTQSRIGATLWQAPQKFIENSPIFMADRVKTPLLMLHNDQDDAVPWYQGIEYYLALRRLGKECFLFNYVGEPHGLRKRANQKDYTVRMQQFFDHHLKGAARPEWMEKGIPYKPREGDRPPPASPPSGIGGERE